MAARDLTLQKQAAAALRLSEERFRVALKNAPVAVFSQDLQLRYTRSLTAQVEETAVDRIIPARDERSFFGAKIQGQ